MRTITLAEARRIAVSALDRNEAARRPPAQLDVEPAFCECGHVEAYHADYPGACEFMDHMGWCTCTGFDPERDA